MKKLFPALLLATCYLLLFSASAGAIIRGSNTSAPAAMASLVDRSEMAYSAYEAHQCGGALVAPRWILTAAHCVFYEGEPNFPEGTSKDVVLGRSNLTGRGGERIAVIAQRSHPAYTLSPLRNDIAMLYLASPSRARPFSLGSAPDQSTSLRALGWGYAKNFKPTTIQEAFFSRVTGSRCFSVSGSRNPVNMLCADNLVRQQSVCIGDSGGPLLLGNSVVGIVSGVRSGYNCFQQNDASLFTNVDAYRGWIEQQISNPPRSSWKAPAREGSASSGNVRNNSKILSGENDKQVRTSATGSLTQGKGAIFTIRRTLGMLRGGWLRISSGRICLASPQKTYLQHTYGCYGSGKRVPMLLPDGGRDAVIWFTASSCSARVRFEAQISNRSKLYTDSYYNRLC